MTIKADSVSDVKALCTPKVSLCGVDLDAASLLFRYTTIIARARKCYSKFTTALYNADHRSEYTLLHNALQVGMHGQNPILYLNTWSMYNTEIVWKFMVLTLVQ